MKSAVFTFAALPNARAAHVSSFYAAGEPSAITLKRDRLLQAQANHLSVGIHDLGESIVRLEEASSTAHKNEQRLRQQLLDLQLADIAASASALNGLSVNLSALARSGHQRHALRPPNSYYKNQGASCSWA